MAIQTVPQRKSRGNTLARALLEWAGWKVLFNGLPADCGVVITYPHTSNWDFPVGILAKWVMGMRAAYFGKDSLFRVPLLGQFMRFTGGIPVERTSSHGLIAQMAGRLREARNRGESMWLSIAPEGTRKYTPHWRSGFYHIALQAGVPLGLAYFDWVHHVVGLTEFLELTGDEAADMARIAAYYAERGAGRHPENAAPVRFAPERK